MLFSEIRELVQSESNAHGFQEASDHVEKIIFALPKDEFMPLVPQIGIIPEGIPHDSSEEKLYAKTADVVLAKAFQELGLCSSVNRERANCADVVARSRYGSYSLVGDAKAFRLSRTAKNQKDFKVKSMVDWRGDHDFAVLVCPYYQYPRTASQVFGQALNGRVLLFSWEHLYFLLRENVVESEQCGLSGIWDLSRSMARRIAVEDRELSFLERQDGALCKLLNVQKKRFRKSLSDCRSMAVSRGDLEIAYWENEISSVRKMSREEAVAGLIEARKLNEKIATIRQFVAYLGEQK